MAERQGELLEEYINNKRINVTKLAEKIGMSRGAIYQWFTKKELTTEQLSLLKKEIGFDLNSVPPSVQSIVSRETKSVQPTGNIIHIPEASYGGFLRGYEDVHFVEKLERWTSPGIYGEHFSIFHKGHSMVKKGDSRSLDPGDLLILKKEENFNSMVNGRMYSLQTIDGIITKIFDKIQDKKGYFHSLNPDYDGEELPLKSIKVVYFVVRVIKDPYNL